MDLLKSLNRKMPELTASDWRALIEAWLRLFFYHYAPLTMSYDMMKNSAQRIENSSAILRAQRIKQMIEYAARLHLARMTCLDKSLTLQKMLSKRNISAQIKIGAQKIEGAMYAHAWVEVNGNPIGEAEDIAQRFIALESMDEINRRKFL